MYSLYMFLILDWILPIVFYHTFIIFPVNLDQQNNIVQKGMPKFPDWGLSIFTQYSSFIYLWLPSYDPANKKNKKKNDCACPSLPLPFISSWFKLNRLICLLFLKYTFLFQVYDWPITAWEDFWLTNHGMESCMTDQSRYGKLFMIDHSRNGMVYDWPIAEWDTFDYTNWPVLKQGTRF